MSKNSILKIIMATIWITFFEFLRNEILLKSIWVEHFESKGLVFETLPVNGILWTIWSLGVAVLIFKLNEKFDFKSAVLIAWLGAFPLMWITIFNLQVLPLQILIFALPLSLIEVVVATLIIRKS